jgi:hypothetical protein
MSDTEDRDRRPITPIYKRDDTKTIPFRGHEFVFERPGIAGLSWDARFAAVQAVKRETAERLTAWLEENELTVEEADKLPANSDLGFEYLGMRVHRWPEKLWLECAEDVDALWVKMDGNDRPENLRGVENFARKAKPTEIITLWELLYLNCRITEREAAK